MLRLLDTRQVREKALMCCYRDVSKAANARKIRFVFKIDLLRVYSSLLLPQDSMVMVYAFPFSATCFKTSPTSTHLTLLQVLDCRGIIKYADGLKLVQTSPISPMECAAIGSVTEILAPLHARKLAKLIVLTLCILRCSIMRT